MPQTKQGKKYSFFPKKTIKRLQQSIKEAVEDYEHVQRAVKNLEEIIHEHNDKFFLKIETCGRTYVIKLVSNVGALNVNIELMHIDMLTLEITYDGTERIKGDLTSNIVEAFLKQKGYPYYIAMIRLFK
mgnify:FL=1